MFKVTTRDPITGRTLYTDVYAVNRSVNNAVTEFLVFMDNGWKWMDATKFIPTGEPCSWEMDG